MYRLKKIVGSKKFSAQSTKIISHYKNIGYNINVLQQPACFDTLAVRLAHRGLPVGLLLLQPSVLFTVEALSLLYLLVIS